MFKILIVIILIVICILFIWKPFRKGKTQGGVYPKNVVLNKNLFNENITPIKIDLFENEYFLYDNDLKIRIRNNYQNLLNNYNNSTKFISDNLIDDNITNYVRDNTSIVCCENCTLKPNNITNVYRLYHYYFTISNYVHDPKTFITTLQSNVLDEIIQRKITFDETIPYLLIHDSHDHELFGFYLNSYVCYTKKQYPYIGSPLIELEIFHDLFSINGQTIIKYRFEKYIEPNEITIYDVTSVLLYGYDYLNSIETFKYGYDVFDDLKAHYISIDDTLQYSLGTKNNINQCFEQFCNSIGLNYSDILNFVNNYYRNIKLKNPNKNVNIQSIDSYSMMYTLLFILYCNTDYITNEQFKKELEYYDICGKLKSFMRRNLIKLNKFRYYYNTYLNALMDMTHKIISISILYQTDFNNIMILTEKYHGRLFESNQIETIPTNEVNPGLLSPKLKDKNLEQQYDITIGNKLKKISIYEIDERLDRLDDSGKFIHKPTCAYLNVSTRILNAIWSNDIFDDEFMSNSEYTNSVNFIDNLFETNVYGFENHPYKINEFSICCVLAEFIHMPCIMDTEFATNKINLYDLFFKFSIMCNTYDVVKDSETQKSFLEIIKEDDSCKNEIHRVFMTPICTPTFKLSNYPQYTSLLAYLLMVIKYYLKSNSLNSNISKIINKFYNVVLKLISVVTNVEYGQNLFSLPTNTELPIKVKNAIRILLTSELNSESVNAYQTLISYTDYKYYYALIFEITYHLVFTYVTKTVQTNKDEMLDGFKWYIMVYLTDYYYNRTMFLVDNITDYIETFFMEMMENINRKTTKKHYRIDQDYVKAIYNKIYNITSNIKLRYNIERIRDTSITLLTSKMDIIATYKILKYPLMKYEITNEKYKNRIDPNLDPLGKTFYIFYGGNYHGEVYKQILKKLYDSDNIKLPNKPIFVNDLMRRDVYSDEEDY